MTATTVHIPLLRTQRLVLRAPRLSDLSFYTAFKTSERSLFTGGPVSEQQARTNFSAVAGLWVMRGYGIFIGALKSEPDTAVGAFGIYHPAGQDEPEFGWSLFDGKWEGKGYATEAMRRVIPWAWSVIGVPTAQSHIDEGNAASVKVAKALGATFDPETTRAANGPGGAFADASPFVNIWRHQSGAWT